MLFSTTLTNTATTPGKNMSFFYAVKDQKCEMGDILCCLQQKKSNAGV
jgi:hypothetical protein